MVANCGNYFSNINIKDTKKNFVKSGNLMYQSEECFCGNDKLVIAH